jgi:hypothetical protein
MNFMPKVLSRLVIGTMVAAEIILSPFPVPMQWPIRQSDDNLVFVRQITQKPHKT